MPKNFFSKTKKTVSKLKEQFLKSNAHSSYQVLVEDFELLTNHYKNKFQLDNFKFVMNGSTNFGQQEVMKNIAAIQIEIDQYTDERTKYALLLKQYWVAPNSCIPGNYFLNKTNTKGSDFAEFYNELYSLLQEEFLDIEGKLKDLDPAEEMKLNELCKNLKCTIKLDEYLDKIIAYLIDQQAKINLTKQQALDEIKLIQTQMQPDEMLIYIFTNNRRRGLAHIETVLLRDNEAIKPAHWFLDDSNIIDTCSIKPLFITDLSVFISPYVEEKRLQPQSGKVECGTLGLLYLKEFLKNDAEQLLHFTLKCSLYRQGNSDIEITNLFIPSPHVLRYSQSQFYNEVLVALLADKDTVSVQSKSTNKTHQICTLKKALNDSIHIARELGDEVTVRQNALILQNLSEFSKKWLDVYDREAKNRQAMQGKKHNLYLTYSSKKMEEHTETPWTYNKTYQSASRFFDNPFYKAKKNEEPNLDDTKNADNNPT